MIDVAATRWRECAQLAGELLASRAESARVGLSSSLFLAVLAVALSIVLGLVLARPVAYLLVRGRASAIAAACLLVPFAVGGAGAAALFRQFDSLLVPPFLGRSWLSVAIIGVLADVWRFGPLVGYVIGEAVAVTMYRSDRELTTWGLTRRERFAVLAPGARLLVVPVLAALIFAVSFNDSSTFYLALHGSLESGGWIGSSWIAQIAGQVTAYGHCARNAAVVGAGMATGLGVLALALITYRVTAWLCSSTLSKLRGLRPVGREDSLRTSLTGTVLALVISLPAFLCFRSGIRLRSEDFKTLVWAGGAAAVLACMAFVIGHWRRGRQPNLALRLGALVVISSIPPVTLLYLVSALVPSGGFGSGSSFVNWITWSVAQLTVSLPAVFLVGALAESSSSISDRRFLASVAPSGTANVRLFVSGRFPAASAFTVAFVAAAILGEGVLNTAAGGDVPAVALTLYNRLRSWQRDPASAAGLALVMLTVGIFVAALYALLVRYEVVANRAEG